VSNGKRCRRDSAVGRAGDDAGSAGTARIRRIGRTDRTGRTGRIGSIGRLDEHTIDVDAVTGDLDHATPVAPAHHMALDAGGG
jgi:hypothetical protein